MPAVVRIQPAIGSSLLQRQLNDVAGDPFARDHRAHAERALVELVVAVALRGVAQLCSDVSQRTFCPRRLPVGAGKLLPCILLLLAALLVVELESERLDQLGTDRVEVLLRLVAGHVGKLAALYCARVAAVPDIGLFGVGMDSVVDELLSVAENFDLVLAAVGRDELADELLERLIRARQDGTLRRLADTHQNLATSPEPAVREVLDLLRRFRVQDVDVDGGHAPRQSAGVDGLGPCLYPHADLLVVDLLQLFPARETAAVVVLAVDRRHLAVEWDRQVAVACELKAQPMYR